MTAPDMRAAALEAWDADLCVVRAKTDGNKLPVNVPGFGRVDPATGKRGAGWKLFQEQRPTRETVAEWFADGHAGLGVVCGAVSGNLEMLELEGRAVREGLPDRLAELVKAAELDDLFARLVNGYMEQTPSDGIHWLYFVSGDVALPSTKLAMRPKTDDELAADPKSKHHTLIETKGEGGFSVCAPSHGTTHKTGKPYVMVRGSFATIPTITADERRQLHDLCRQLSEVDTSKRTPPPEPVPVDQRVQVGPWSQRTIGNSWVKVVREHLKQTVTMRALLERYGWTYAHDAQGIAYMAHPSASHDVSALINKSDRLLVFSSNTSFEHYGETGGQTRTYDRLEVIAEYECGGDRMAAARRIADETGIYATWQSERTAQRQADYEELRKLVYVLDDPAPTVDTTTGEITTTPATAVVADTTSDLLDAPDGYRYSDTGNAHRLIAMAGNSLRFVPKWRRWIVYADGRWQLDHADTLVAHKAGQIGVSLLAEPFMRALWEITDEKKRNDAIARHLSWARRSEMTAGIAGTIGTAATVPGVAIDHALLDADPWLFNCRNGTVDLHTGNRRPHRADDMLTMQAAVDYDPTAKAPRFLAFLAEILPDNELRYFVQRLFGTVLVGAQVEHILPVALGGGANGKSTLTKIVADIVGDYAVVASVDLLLALKHDTHPTSKASLFRRRFAHSGELPQGARLDEAQIKRLTGGDEIVARRMREDEWQFIPSHTLFLHANHRPSIDGTDDGIWRRVLLIPFDVQIPPERRDSKLADTIVADEAPGVLRWMLDGLADYLDGGLRPPDVVKAATSAYRQASDTVASFLADCGATFDPTGTVAAGELLQRHAEWFASNGIGDKEKDHYQRVVLELKRRGVLSGRTSSRGRFWRGLAVGGDDQ
jgi:putative DNA primase/helicase